MSGRAILSWMLCGVIVGLVARLVAPGRQGMGLILPMVLGLVGGVVGGLLYSWFQGAPAQPFSFSGDAWHGWIVAGLGAGLVLCTYVVLARRNSW